VLKISAFLTVAVDLVTLKKRRRREKQRMTVLFGGKRAKRGGKVSGREGETSGLHEQKRERGEGGEGNDLTDR